MTAIFESSKLDEQMPLDPFLTDELGKSGEEGRHSNLIIVENHPSADSLPKAAPQIELADSIYPLGRVREEVELSYPSIISAGTDKGTPKSLSDSPVNAIETPAKAESVPKKLDPELVKEFEQSHAVVLECWEAMESKGLTRINAQKRLEEAQRHEKEVAGKLGFKSWTEFMVSGRTSGKINENPETDPKLPLRERVKDELSLNPLREALSDQRELNYKLDYKSGDLTDQEYAELRTDARKNRYQKLTPATAKAIALFTAVSDIGVRGMVKLTNSKTWLSMTNSSMGSTTKGSKEVFPEGVPEDLKTPQFELSDPRYIAGILALGSIATGLVVAHEWNKNRPRRSRNEYLPDNRPAKQPRRKIDQKKSDTVTSAVTPEVKEPAKTVKAKKPGLISNLKGRRKASTKSAPKPAAKSPEAAVSLVKSNNPVSLERKKTKRPVNSAVSIEHVDAPKRQQLKPQSIPSSKPAVSDQLKQSKTDQSVSRRGVPILEKPTSEAHKGFKLDKNGLYIPEGYDSEYAVLKEAMRIGKQQGLGSIRYTDKH